MRRFVWKRDFGVALLYPSLERHGDDVNFPSGGTDLTIPTSYCSLSYLCELSFRKKGKEERTKQQTKKKGGG